MIPDMRSGMNRKTVREQLLRHIEVMKVIESEGPIGRTRIAKILKLSEPTVNSSYRFLKKNELVIVGIQGMTVAENWREEIQENIRKFLEEIAAVLRD